MRRPLAFLLSGLLAFAVLTVGSLTTTSPTFAATTIAPTTTCGNTIDNAGGLGLICEVTVVNTITAGGGSAADARVDPRASCDANAIPDCHPIACSRGNCRAGGDGPAGSNG